ncbi:MAG: [FeFe] hydrogenase H-cluster radical SAM maturase HydE [Blautia sp.]|nr:[FeFe] hydrogenase H-cluster radical SAM maturase HydE [Blautia sp.]
MDVVEKFLQNPDSLSQEEFVRLISLWQNSDVCEKLRKEAVLIRKKHYGNKIFLRGLIEFTNYCKNNCYYCGIRAGNKRAVRYRLSMEEILECCEQGHRLGFQTYVLQGGEDPWYTQERVVEIVSAIKRKYPECAVTLSIGEKEYEEYRSYRNAGADRYLLRHETADEEHYRILHPEQMCLSNRMECLYNLKKLGFQTGAGFMTGAPGQTMETLAKDLMFLSKLQPDMVGVGPFIPHHDTCFSQEPQGSAELTLFLLSVIRILLPKCLLPSTTALNTIDPEGREKGILAGANVLMPNLSPKRNRKHYELYDNKNYDGEEAAEGIMRLSEKMSRIGYQIVMEKGDAVGYNN